MTSERLHGVVRVNKALEDVASENGRNALAVSCWSGFQEVYGVAICGALSRLNEKGIVAPCEADVPSAVAMLMLNAIIGKPSTVDDLVALDESDNTVNLRHCFVMTGDIVAKKGFAGSSGWVANLRMGGKPLSLPDLINTIVTRRVNHHYPTGWGDLEAQLREISQILENVPKEAPVGAAGLLCTWRELSGGFSDFRLARGDDILVFGAGPAGTSFVRFSRLLGLGWVGSVDPLPLKREMARKLGADAVFSPEGGALGELARRRGRRSTR